MGDRVEHTNLTDLKRLVQASSAKTRFLWMAIAAFYLAPGFLDLPEPAKTWSNHARDVSALLLTLTSFAVRPEELTNSNTQESIYNDKTP